MSKPKLALIPSGYKSGKVYSILPNDATGDFDFTRQSIGTRVRKDGLIEEAKTVGSITNDFLHSEDYSQSEWNKSNLTVTTNQELAPDGTNTADEIFETSATSFKNINQQTSVTANKRYTTSFFVKYNNIQYLQITGSSGFVSSIVNFDIQNKTIVHNPSNELARIDELANGWVRISLTLLCSVTTNGRMLIVAINSATASRLPSYTGNTSNSFYLWGGMMSEGALSDYIKTEGSQVTKRVETFTDVPRLDWLNSSCPSLKLEPQRTNEATYSQDFTQTSYWNNVIDVVATKNEAIAPDGTLTANKIQANSGTNFKILRKGAFTIPSGITMSMFVKRGNHDYIIFKAQGDYNFNLSTLQWGGSYSNVGYEDYGNGWIRLYATTSSSVLSYFGIYLSDSSFNQSWTATGNEFVYVWGGQYETGTYPTSYIKTEASTVTRLKDECYGSGTANLFDTEVGVIYLELKKNGLESSFSGLSLSDGTTSNRIQIRYVADSNTIQVVVRVGGSAVVVLSHTLTDVTERHKIAFKFEADDYAFWVNGAEVGTDTSGALPPNLSEFAFDDGNGANLFFGSVYDARVYTNNLTDTELTELTTL